MGGMCSTILMVAVAFIAIAVLVIVAVGVYRPIPAQYAETQNDRIAGRILEPITRIIYYYPSRLCPTALCMLYWTRFTMSAMNRAIAPWFYHDSHMRRETTHWDGVKVRVYHPINSASASSDGAVIYIHGGGFGMGSTEMFESTTRTMAREINARLFVSVDYRLSPETVFPGPLEDCERVLEYVIANGPTHYGIDPRKIILIGDSAGGNLVAAITQRRRARGVKPKILGQVLVYPLLQLSDMQTYSYRYVGKLGEGLAFVDPISVAFYYLWYAGVDANAHPEYASAATRNGHVSNQAKAASEQFLDYSLIPDSLRQNFTDKPALLPPIEELANYMTPFLTNPDFAPLMQPDLADLPSALVATCEYDVLRDEGILYALRLKQAGVPTQWTHFKNGFHAMLNMHNVLDIGSDMLSVINEWTIKVLLDAQPNNDRDEKQPLIHQRQSDISV